MKTLDVDTDDDMPTWAAFFRELDQWDTVETYENGFSTLLACSPKIGHLLAHEGGGFQIIHHVHQDGEDDIDDDDDEGDIWALIGAGGTAATVVLSSTGTYDKQTGVNYEWSKMVQWTEIKDIAMTHPNAAKLLGDAKGKAKGKGAAKGTKSRKGKPKDYDEDLFSSSEDDDDFDPEDGVGAAISLPNVLPIPGFLVAALMDAYTTTDAGFLCLAAIDAIKKRARVAGVDPASSTAAQKAAFVPIWIWNHATERAKVPPGRAKGGVGTSITVSQRADLWASGVHRLYLQPTSSGVNAQMSPSIRDAAPLANALALQAASKGPTTTVAKKRC